MPVRAPDGSAAQEYFYLNFLGSSIIINSLHFEPVTANRLTIQTIGNCTTLIHQIWQSTTLTAPCQRLHHTHPRSGAYASCTAQDFRPNACSNFSSPSGPTPVAVAAWCNNCCRPAASVRLAGQRHTVKEINCAGLQ